MNGTPDDDLPGTDAGSTEHRVSMADGELKEPVKLPTFLGGVAELMQLQPKESGRPEATSGAAARRVRASRPRQAALLIALAALVAGVLLARALQPWPVTTLPAALAGVWRTDAARYADRRLQITTTSLGFQAGPDATSGMLYPIVRVRRSGAPEGILFRVEYLQDGNRLELDFVWQGSPRPAIWFAHQKNLVWTRGSSGDSIATSPRSAR